MKQRVVQGLTEEACIDAAEQISSAAVASMCTELAREIYFNCRWAGDVATSIMISAALASAGHALPPPNQLATYSEAMEASSRAADMLRAVSQISRRNRGRLTLHTLSMPSHKRSNGVPLPYHVHTPAPAVPVLNLCVHAVFRALFDACDVRCSYERLPPQSIPPDTEIREFDFWRTISIRQDFINTKVIT